MKDFKREKELIEMYYLKPEISGNHINYAELMTIAKEEKLSIGYIERTIFFD